MGSYVKPVAYCMRSAITFPSCSSMRRCKWMTQPAYKISVAIIARDEEAQIGDCLDSVRWADEIVVVDTGSGDRTLEICRKFTPHVYSLPWQGYAPAKNAALELTTSE